MYCTGKSTVARITAAWLRTITTDIHLPVLLLLVIMHPSRNGKNRSLRQDKGGVAEKNKKGKSGKWGTHLHLLLISMLAALCLLAKIIIIGVPVTKVPIPD